MLEPSTHHLAHALCVFAEPLVLGRRVVVVGDAELALGARLLALGARLVHVYDPDAARAQRASLGAERGEAIYALPPDEFGVRDGAFDVALVPDVGELAGPSSILARLRRLTGDAGVILVGAPNPEGARGPLPGLPGGPRRRAIDYYELYDLVALQFAHVRMVGEVPFTGVTLAELGEAQEAPAVRVDTQLVDGIEAPVDFFFAVGSQRPIDVDPYVLVQLPPPPTTARELDVEARVGERAALAEATLRAELLEAQVSQLRDEQRRLTADVARARRSEEQTAGHDAQRLDEVRRSEEIRREDGARRAEESRIAEESRRAEQARYAAEARRLEDVWRSEEARRSEETRRVNEARRLEDARHVEELRAALASEAEKRRLVEEQLREEALRRQEIEIELAATGRRAEELEEAITLSQRAVAEAQSRAGEGHGRAERMVQELARLHDEVEQQKERAARFARELEEERRTRQRTEQELQAARRNPEVATLKQRVAALEESLRVAEEALREWEERFAQLRNDALRTTHQVAELNAELARVGDAHAQEIAQYEAVLRNRAQAVQALELELVRRERIVHELVAAVEDAREGREDEAVAAWAREAERARTEAETLRQELATKSRELAVAVETRDAAVRELSGLRERLDALALDVARREADLETAGWRVSELSQKLAIAEQDLEGARAAAQAAEERAAQQEAAARNHAAHDENRGVSTQPSGGVSPASPSQVSPSQVSPSQVSPSQVSPSQASPPEDVARMVAELDALRRALAQEHETLARVRSGDALAAAQAEIERQSVLIHQLTQKLEALGGELPAR